MKYGIINKTTKKFFAGFNSDNSAKWTNDKNKAWSNSKLSAKCQASFIVSLGAQQKPVAL